MDWSLLKCFHQVNAGENGGAGELRDKFLDVWHRIRVQLCEGIESVIVTTGTDFTFLLDNDVECR